MAEINVNEQNFEEIVLQSELPVLVDFWAPWCGPCRMLAPMVEQVAAEQEGKAKVVKVNIDEAPRLAEQYNIATIPTLMVFKAGQPVSKAVGARPKSAITAMLQ